MATHDNLIDYWEEQDKLTDDLIYVEKLKRCIVHLVCNEGGKEPPEDIIPQSEFDEIARRLGYYERR